MKWYAPQEIEQMLRRNGHRCTVESGLPDSEQLVCSLCLTTVAHRKQATANESTASSYTLDLWSETPAGREECPAKPE